MGRYLVLMGLVLALAVPCSGAETVFEGWRSAVGQFASPICVSVYPGDGSCWVADQGGYVVHLSAAGEELWRSASGEFSGPSGVAVNTWEGTCWVADSGHGQVVHVSETGEELARSASDLTFPIISIAVDHYDGSCWTGEYNNSSGRLSHFSSAGEKLWTSSNFQSFRPYSLSVDTGNHSCWVGNCGYSELLLFTTDGTKYSYGGLPGLYPAAVSVNAYDGSCWGAIALRNTVRHYDWRGDVTSPTLSMTRPCLVSASRGDGSCWVAYNHGTQVGHFDETGETLYRSASNAFSRLKSLSVDPADGSCWAVDSGVNQVVKLKIAPGANFGAQPRTVLVLGQVTFTDVSTNSPTSWYWEFGDGSSSTQRSPFHVYSTAGKYTISLTASSAEDSFTCTKADYITVYAQLRAEASDDVVLPAGGSTVLQGWATGGILPYQYSWKPRTGLSTPDSAQTVASPVVTTTYTLTVYDDRAYGSCAQVTVYVLPAPSLTATAVSPTQINLSWTDDSDLETSFKLERKTSDTDWVKIATLNANTTSYTNTGLTNGATYSYRLRAYRSLIGFSNYSNEVSAAPLAFPPAPVLSATPVSTTQITLTWTDASELETGFKLERKVGDGTWVNIATLAADTTSYSNRGLSTDFSYSYRVRASRTGVGYSPYSNEVAASPLALPPTPALTAKAGIPGRVLLSWTDDSEVESSFKLERKVEGGTWSNIATTAADATSYTNLGLTSGTTYFYRIRAYRSGVGFSAYSNEVSAIAP